MGHYHKLYEKMKNNPKDVCFDDIDKLLTKIGGFTRREPGSGSSHYTYSHPDIEDILTIVKDKPVKTVYVKRALIMLDSVIEEF